LNKTDSDWILKEIIHSPVTFNTESLQRDTDKLNDTIRKGYQINEIVKTETGIVYVLMKWEKQKKIISENSKKELSENSNLKDCYNNFCEANKNC